ncbi:PKD domain-containing protein [Crocinitomix algicola]|uniref:PKD domain-containing protein n=1 Tax=Crocinitomix algicola TaxID=1740263 RepID=UPI00082E720F|nr:PKD domain-containing protein [Crocinitomix algicola]
MKNFYLNVLVLLVVGWIGTESSYSQIIGASAYLIGDNVEIGINDAGHEGAPRLIGSNNRSNLAAGSPVYFGFVANPQLDGWGNYDGDFFTPGTPENGFGIEVGGVNYSNNASGNLEQIPGSITSYEEVGECITVMWEGEVANVHVTVIYRLISTELYYTTEVILTNTGALPMTDVYYYRNVDPDNNVTIGGGYATTNTIVSQPGADCEVALVTAEQNTPWDSYMGFGAIGENFRVARGGFANRDASNIWNGVGGLSGVEGSSATADRAIALGYRVETLTPGEPESFMYTVVLDESQVDAAIASLFYFSYEGGGGIIDECAPIVDTALVCPGQTVELSIEGPTVGDYDWEWSPPIGLSTTIGPVTDASPATTTTYTVVGTPAVGCLASTIEKTIIVEVSDLPIINYTDPGPLCGDFDLTTLEIENLEGSPFEIVYYSVVPDSVGQTEGLWDSDIMSSGDEVYMMMFNPITGCFDVEQVIIDFSGGADAGEDNTAAMCNNAGSTMDLNDLLVGAEAGGIWAEVSDVLSGGFTPGTGILDASGVDEGIYEFEYIALGLAPCTDDSARITITINPAPLAGLDADTIMCNSEGTEMDLNILLDGNSDVGVWLETSASGQFDPVTGIFDGSGLASGTYTFTYTVSGVDPCVPDVADFTVELLPSPNILAGADVELCIGEDVILEATGAGVGGSYEWDLGVVNGEAFSPDATNTYTVIGTDINGCTDFDAVTVTVHDLPTIVAGDDLAICQGEEVTLAGTGAGAGGTYVWTGGVVDGIAFSPDETETYTVVGTDMYGCENTADVTVVVNENPLVIAGDDLETCEGEFVTLEAYGAGAGAEYTWTGGVENGVPFIPLETATYSVVGMNEEGCTADDDVTVTVNPLPEVEVEEDFAVCDGDPVTLEGAGAGAGAVYLWDGGVTDGLAFIPTEPATYTCTGIDVNGCMNTDEVMVDINELPEIFAGIDFAVCDGEDAVVAGEGAGAGGTYAWTGDVVDGVPFAPELTDTYIVTGTDINGCSGTDDVEVELLELPAIDAGPDAELCIGDSYVLVGAGGGAGAVYSWSDDFEDGEAITPTETFTLTLTGTDAFGCTNTDEILITVHDLPLVEAGDDTLICEGEEVVLIGTGAGVGAVYTWTDDVVDGTPFIPAVTATYIVTGTDINGCENTDEVAVVVNAAPPVVAGPDQSVCIGDVVFLNGAGAGVDAEYIWSDGIEDGAPFIPDYTATYTVTGTDEYGCVGTDDVVVTVMPLPIISAGPDREICQGDYVTLVGSGAGAGGTYEWMGGVINAEPFGPHHSSDYIVIGTTAEGCSNSDTMSIIVNLLPDIAFTVDEVMGCAPLTVNFFPLIDGDDYVWTFGDGSTYTGGTPEHTFEYSGTYDITLSITSEEGCTASETFDGYIDVAESPIASFIHSPDEVTINDTWVEFENTSIGAETYIWNFGDGSAEVADEHTEHEFPAHGNTNYAVKLTAINAQGCKDENTQLVKIIDQLIYYVPNTFTPDGDMYNQTFTPVFAAGVDVFDYHIMIFNRWGELVFESFDTNYGWSGTYGGGDYVDDGVYIYKMEFGETMSDKRHYVEGHVTLLK